MMWRRGVALASAPLAALNYNRWDFLPLQMRTCLTVAMLAVFSAWRAREPGETLLAPSGTSPNARDSISPRHA